MHNLEMINQETASLKTKMVEPMHSGCIYVYIRHGKGICKASDSKAKGLYIARRSIYSFLF